MFRRSLSLVALAAGLALTAGACGGNGTNDHAAATSRRAKTATTAATPTTATAEAAASGDGADFCASAAAANPAVALANASGSSDVSKLERDINTAVATAPSAIKADVQTMADVEFPILDGKVPPAQIGQKMADPQFRAAVQHISTWAASNCRG
jgi:hypothetical protein